MERGLVAAVFSIVQKTDNNRGRWHSIAGEWVWFDAGVVMGPEFLEHLPDTAATHTTTLLYKGRNGELKELRVVQPSEHLKLDLKDLQILAREIAKILREDG